MWSPIFDSDVDRRVVNALNPTFPPLASITGEDYRTIFNKLRTSYTICHTNWSASGKLTMGIDFGEGDDDFLENFANGDHVLLLVHQIWSRTPPSYCLRTIPEDMQEDIGLQDYGGRGEESPHPIRNNGGAAQTPLLSGSTPITSALSNSGAGKRKISPIDLTSVDTLTTKARTDAYESIGAFFKEKASSSKSDASFRRLLQIKAIMAMDGILDDDARAKLQEERNNLVQEFIRNKKTN